MNTEYSLIEVIWAIFQRIMSLLVPVLKVVIFIGGIGVLLYAYFSPIGDGDTYFHLAYGKQIIENKTITPDESVYTFDIVGYPKQNLYPGWIPQGTFYLIYKLFGDISGLYSFRFIIITILALFFLVFTERLNSFNFLWLSFAFGTIVTMSVGLMLKAEMFSAFFFSVSVFLYFWAKAKGKRKALYLFPLICLVWSNSHIGILFGLFFWGLAFAGELIFNYLLAGTLGRDKTSLWRDMLITLLLALPTLLLNPNPGYYPRLISAKITKETVNGIIKGKVDLDKTSSASRIMAYKPISLDSPLFGRMAQVYFAALLLAFFYFKSGRNLSYKEALKTFPWELLVILLPFARLYFIYGRTTYFMPPIAFFTLVYISAPFFQQAGEKMLRYATMLGFLVFAVYANGILGSPLEKKLSMTAPWFAPELESDYIEACLPNAKYLMPTYGAGSYLLWRFGPERKVLIDTRTNEEFSNYYNFSNGYKVKEMLERWKPDTLVLSFRHWFTLAQVLILSKDEWQPVFWGNFGMVFTRKGTVPICSQETVANLIKKIPLYLDDGRYVRNMLFTLLIKGDPADLELAVQTVKKNYGQFFGEEIKDLFNIFVDGEHKRDGKERYAYYLSQLYKLKSAPYDYPKLAVILFRREVLDAYKKGQYMDALNWEQMVSTFLHYRICTTLYNQAIIKLKAGQTLADAELEGAGKAALDAFCDCQLPAILYPVAKEGYKRYYDIAKNIKENGYKVDDNAELIFY